MHRSQGMGSPERRGPSRNYFVHGGRRTGARRTFSTASIPPGTACPGGAEIGRLLAEALAASEPEQPDKAIPALLEGAAADGRRERPLGRR